MSNTGEEQGRGSETTRGTVAPEFYEPRRLSSPSRSSSAVTPSLESPLREHLNHRGGCWPILLSASYAVGNTDPLSGSRPSGYLHTMTLAEKIFNEVRALPETQAREVLDFVGFLKSRRHTDRLIERKTALAELARYRGRFKAQKFSRDELYDRASLR